MEQLRRIVALLRDPRTPKLPRLALALAAAYLIWPADLIPEFIVPVAGYLDDVTFVWLASRWLLKSGTSMKSGGAAPHPPNPPLAPRD
jgi:uncharacterized membrane protein YkvA (DUF1232 family)